jgi:hypothetical protein
MQLNKVEGQVPGVHSSALCNSGGLLSKCRVISTSNV